MTDRLLSQASKSTLGQSDILFVDVRKSKVVPIRYMFAVLAVILLGILLGVASLALAMLTSSLHADNVQRVTTLNDTYTTLAESGGLETSLFQMISDAIVARRQELADFFSATQSTIDKETEVRNASISSVQDGLISARDGVVSAIAREKEERSDDLDNIQATISSLSNAGDISAAERAALLSNVNHTCAVMVEGEAREVSNAGTALADMMTSLLRAEGMGRNSSIERAQSECNTLLNDISSQLDAISGERGAATANLSSTFASHLSIESDTVSTSLAHISAMYAPIFAALPSPLPAELEAVIAQCAVINTTFRHELEVRTANLLPLSDVIEVNTTVWQQYDAMMEGKAAWLSTINGTVPDTLSSPSPANASIYQAFTHLRDQWVGVMSSINSSLSERVRVIEADVIEVVAEREALLSSTYANLTTLIDNELADVGTRALDINTTITARLNAVEVATTAATSTRVRDVNALNASFAASVSTVSSQLDTVEEERNTGANVVNTTVTSLLEERYRVIDASYQAVNTSFHAEKEALLSDLSTVTVARQQEGEVLNNTVLSYTSGSFSNVASLAQVLNATVQALVATDNESSSGEASTAGLEVYTEWNTTANMWYARMVALNCSHVLCYGRGECNADMTACQCESGYSGDRCDACGANRFGPLCAECPFGSCSEHGSCHDGMDGTGQCVCEEGWDGESCDNCKRGFFGDNCTACPDCGEHGMCVDGINGTGTCMCMSGWTGEDCSSCKTGFFGANCGDSCDRTCGPKGSCNDGVDGDGSCVCEEHYAGARCDECASGYFGYACTACPTCGCEKETIYETVVQHQCTGAARCKAEQKKGREERKREDSNSRRASEQASSKNAGVSQVVTKR